jgi:hypothetical protein
MGGGAGASGTGQAIVVSDAPGSGDTSDDSGSYSISTPNAIDDPVFSDDDIDGDSNTTDSEPPSSLPPSVAIESARNNSNSDFFDTGILGELTEDFSELYIHDKQHFQEIRLRLFQFIEAQKLAGQRMTAQQIADKLELPLHIAQIAVINPVGKNIRVDIPDISDLDGDGILVAGARQAILNTIRRLIPVLKKGREAVTKWILKSPPKINPDKQGKHIPGHKNFQPGKSIFTHPNPQALVNKFAGKGQPVSNNVPKGQPGYKERVDFREVIGKYIDPTTGQSVSTTKGIIHYSKDGVHIVPARP